ncbi:MAG: hypothetical protein K8F24_05085, partial [Bacteroidales bacterium]|nr:hypothetical protein [Bacteroidales bacterium]
MKKYKILVLLAAMVLSFSACETDIDDPSGLRNVGVVPSIVNLNPAAFDVNDPENTFIKFDVDATDAVNEIKVLASFNGDLRRVEIKSYGTLPIKDEVIYMRDVASALGIQLNDINPGDVFNLELLT